MIKKCLKLMIMLFILEPFMVNALAKEDMQQMKLNEVLTINFLNERTGGFQGFAITKKYYVLSAINKENTKETLVAIDILTKKVVKQVEHTDLGHANDMTYNESTNEISVLNGNSIVIVDGETLETKKTINNVNYNAIAMNNQKYYFWGSKKGYIYSYNGNNLTKEKEFDVPTNLITQGIGYYDNYLYFCAFEQGAIGQYEPYYDGILEQGANAIYAYDLNGTLKNTFYIPNGYGEIESLAFHDGDFYMLFNNGNKAIIYTPEKETVSETFSITIDESYKIPYASLSNIDGTLETVSQENGKFTFSPITYKEAGTYSYTISKAANNSEIMPLSISNDTESDSDVIEIDVNVNYNQINNSLSSIVKYNNNKETFSNPMLLASDEGEDEDIDSDNHYCAVIDGVYYNSLGEETDIDGYNETCKYVENPQTGITFSNFGLLGLGIIVIVLILNKKNIINKLK